MSGAADAAALLAAIAEVTEAAKNIHGRLALRDDIKKILREGGME
jgi:hypothetical protein